MSNNNRVYNVLIVGVGGQGIILASDVLAQAAARTVMTSKRTRSTVWPREAVRFPVMFVSEKP